MCVLCCFSWICFPNRMKNEFVNGLLCCWNGVQNKSKNSQNDERMYYTRILYKFRIMPKEKQYVCFVLFLSVLNIGWSYRKNKKPFHHGMTITDGRKGADWHLHVRGSGTCYSVAYPYCSFNRLIAHANEKEIVINSIGNKELLTLKIRQTIAHSRSYTL